MTVLDASALLAFLLGEPGAQMVAPLLAESCLSTVNLAEVIGQFERQGRSGAGLAEQLILAGVELVPFSVAEAELAAALLPQTRAAGLSLGDRACLALALARGVRVLTADRAWAGVSLGLTIRFIRP